jgi:putative membrane protein
MQKFITKTLITSVAVIIASYLLTGINVPNAQTALLVAVVLGLLNNFVKPILVVLTIPITLVTLGLFLFVINIIIVKWVATLVPGFTVTGWWAALWFSIIVSVFTSFIERLIKTEEDKKQSQEE